MICQRQTKTAAPFIIYINRGAVFVCFPIYNMYTYNILCVGLYTVPQCIYICHICICTYIHIYYISVIYEPFPASSLFSSTNFRDRVTDRQNGRKTHSCRRTEGHTEEWIGRLTERGLHEDGQMDGQRMEHFLLLPLLLPFFAPPTNSGSLPTTVIGQSDRLIMCTVRVRAFETLTKFFTKLHRLMLGHLYSGA